MVEDEWEELDQEKTHSVLIDYYQILKQAKWTVFSIIGSSIAILLIIYALIFNSLIIEPKDDVQHSMLVLFFGFLVGICIGLPLTSGDLILKIILKGKEKERQLLNVRNRLIHRFYVINFEIVNAEGKTQLERLFNHLSLVFPEIKQINEKWQKKGKNIIEFNRKQRVFKSLTFLHNYDLVLQTKTGIFIVKIFNKTVTFEDVENTIKALNLHQMNFKLFGPQIINRVIILAKSYDKFFDTIDFVEKMKNIRRKFNVDLIEEEDEFGYATIWID